MGRTLQQRGCRGILEQLRPGDAHIFPCAPGQPYRTLQTSIAAILCRHFDDIKTEFSQRRALLVFDETEVPVACCVVTRSKA